jgi:hypothetical protein
MLNFNPRSNHPDRAVQAWTILVAAAMNRQTLTYLKLSILMYKKPAAGVMDKILGHIAFYCIDNRIPPLTSIVVGKTRGTPGTDFPLTGANLDAERERVYDFDWYDIYPPKSEYLKSSYALHSK